VRELLTKRKKAANDAAAAPALSLSTTWFVRHEGVQVAGVAADAIARNVGPVGRPATMTAHAEPSPA